MSTIRLTLHRIPVKEILIVRVPGWSDKAVVAPIDFGKYGFEVLATAILNHLKNGDPFEWGFVNLVDDYFQRQLRHSKSQKFFVDVKIPRD